MTRPRYLAYVPADRAALDHWRPRIATAAARLPGFALSPGGERFLLVSQSAGLAVSGEDGELGRLLGAVFRRGEQTPATEVSQGEARAILASGGKALIDRFWGAYVAILPDPAGRTHIVRSPFGDLACYYANCPAGTFLASDIDLLTRVAGVAPGIDWQAIARQLIAPDIRRDATCLAGITELAGGDRLTIGDAAGRDTLWTPWTFVARERRCDDAARAAAMLVDTICQAVAARTAGLDGMVLLLSGGLDFSIVAAALAQAGRRCTAVTMVTNDPGGDERVHARATAGHLAMPLREIVRDTAHVDIERSAAAGLPYPTEKSFSQATMHAAGSVAASTGANAIVHGGGGDNIFCALQSAAPVADLIRTGTRGVGLMRLTRSIATLAQVTSVAVLRQAAARLWLRGPAYRWPVNTDLLSRDAQAEAASALDHGWLDPPPGALPGSAAHIALMLGALSLVQSPDAAASVPSLALLLAQPVIEACLSVPSWRWFDRGRDRAAARHGFSTLLPEAVAWRRSKGAMDSFIVEIFDANRTRLKPFLLDGMLAASGLIEREAIAAILDDRAPVKGLAYARVMQFADVEAWLRSRS